MPIYEYRCAECGHQQEFLQKVSDAPLTVCTRCGKATFSKMVTAAGFQLKGSGWYATDFKGGGKPKPTEAKPSGGTSDAKPSGGTSDAPKGDAKPSEGGGEKKASAGGCGGGCSCH